MVAGRPREYDKVAIGKEFIEWAKTHPDCLTVPHFTTNNGYSTHSLVTWAKEDPEFLRYYTEAKEIIGINRLNASRPKYIEELDKTIPGSLDKTIYLRHVGNFDPDIRNFDREEKQYEIIVMDEAKKQSVSENIKEGVHAILDQISTLQSERKIANSINKSDS